jgi:hypothetical protein
VAQEGAIVKAPPGARSFGAARGGRGWRPGDDGQPLARAGGGVLVAHRAASAIQGGGLLEDEVDQLRRANESMVAHLVSLSIGARSSVTMPCCTR